MDYNMCAIYLVLIALAAMTGSTSRASLDVGFRIICLSFSPDGKTLAVGGDGGQVQLWNVKTRALHCELSGHSEAVRSLAFSPDGAELASGGDDSSVRIWKVPTGEQKWQAGVDGNLFHQVFSVAFTPDGRELLAAGGDPDPRPLWEDQLRIWDAHTGALKRSFTVQGHGSLSMDVSPNGRLVATGGHRISDSAGDMIRKDLLIRDIRTGKCLKVFSTDKEVIYSVAFSHNGKKIVCGTREGIIYIWDVVTGGLKMKVEGASSSIETIAVSADDRWIIAGGLSLIIWNAQTGKVARYNADGTRATMTNALGKVWQYFYDANKNLTSEKDPLLNETKYGYDSLARRIWIQLPENVPNGPKTEFTFDNNDRVTQVTNPDATFRTTTYNCCVKTEDKDENNKRTQYEYNLQNCLIKIWPADDPNKTGTPILLEYYLDGQLKSVTDRKNQKTTLTYDGGHRQTKVTYADTTKFEEFTFNAASQLTSRKKQDGNIINYTYDERGRRVGIDYPTGTDPTFTLDNASQRTQMVDATGTYSYTYSDRGETLSIAYPGGKTVSYTFDVAGQRTKRTLTSYGDTTYLFNDAGGISSFTTPDSKTFSYTYNKNGAVTQQTNGNTTKAIYTYNNRLFLTNLSNQKSDNTVISSFAYTVDNVGNALRVTENDNTYTDWFYDDLYQLTRETKRNIVGTQDTRGNYVDDTAQTDLSYAYDLAQNRTSMTNNLTSTTTSYTYNNMNQMLTAGNITLTYDANGNNATKVVNMQTTTYTWDFENKLKQIDYPGGSNNTFATNTDGQRMTANDTDGNRRLLHDGGSLVGEQDITSGNLIATYDQGLGGLLTRQTSGSSVRYHHFDGIYSTRQLSDSSQAVTDTASFDAWGNLLASSGTTFYPHKYVGGMGYYWSSQSGLDLLGARYYSPSTGRLSVKIHPGMG